METNMQIAKELAAAAEELISIAKPKKGQIFVLGCSTSEVLGNKIGTGGSSETAGRYYIFERSDRI